jgi:hypothetical protein
VVVRLPGVRKKASFVATIESMPVHKLVPAIIAHSKYSIAFSFRRQELSVQVMHPCCCSVYKPNVFLFALLNFFFLVRNCKIPSEPVDYIADFILILFKK